VRPFAVGLHRRFAECYDKNNNVPRPTLDSNLVALAARGGARDHGGGMRRRRRRRPATVTATAAAADIAIATDIAGPPPELQLDLRHVSAGVDVRSAMCRAAHRDGSAHE
jgi:hypothetical protein